jgi:hypothetical protein
MMLKLFCNLFCKKIKPFGRQQTDFFAGYSDFDCVCVARPLVDADNFSL